MSMAIKSDQVSGRSHFFSRHEHTLMQVLNRSILHPLLTALWRIGGLICCWGQFDLISSYLKESCGLGSPCQYACRQEVMFFTLGNPDTIPFLK